MTASPVSYIERTRELYARQVPYRWVHHDPTTEPPPWSPIRKPLEELRVALIASGGVYAPDQEPFHFRNDCSHREIPTDADPGELRVAHFGYDITDARRDPGCVLPLSALGTLEREGAIRSFSSPAFSFMGGIYSARRVKDELAPRLCERVLRQEADLAYLVPA